MVMTINLEVRFLKDVRIEMLSFTAWGFELTIRIKDELIEGSLSARSSHLACEGKDQPGSSPRQASLSSAQSKH